MSNNTTINTTNNNEISLLQSKLSTQVGADQAKEIITSIMIELQSEDAPSYMAVKAASELLETCRSHAKEMIRDTRLKRQNQSTISKNVFCFNNHKTNSALEDALSCYFTSAKLFYPLMQRAMRYYQSVPQMDYKPAPVAVSKRSQKSGDRFFEKAERQTNYAA